MLSTKYFRQVRRGNQCEQVVSGRQIWVCGVCFFCQPRPMTPDPLQTHPKQHLARSEGIWQCHNPLEEASMAGRSSSCCWLDLGNTGGAESCSSVAQCHCAMVCFGPVPPNAHENLLPLLWMGSRYFPSGGLGCWTHRDAVRFSFGCFAPARGQSEMSYCWDMI